MSKRAWHPSLLPVIPVQSVPHLENYKFTPAQQGCVDSFLTKYWWNVIARAMPPVCLFLIQSIHPNVVTIIGSVFMLFAFTISIAHVTGLILKKTACIYFTIAFCVFMYQVCLHSIIFFNLRPLCRIYVNHSSFIISHRLAME